MRITDNDDLARIACGCGGEIAQHKHEQWTSSEASIACSACDQRVSVNEFWLTIRAERAERLVEHWSSRYSTLWYEHRR